MPKPARSQEEVNQFKEEILDAALEILYTEGFFNLSMRQLAKKTGMTAANIYNYFAGKDEIYLAIQTRGFATLANRFRKIEKKENNPVSAIKQMIRAYIEFGMEYPDQYEIMFTRNTPKFADYVGTPLEPSARIEKETALQVANIAQRVLSRILGAEPAAENAVITVWTAVHGLVSLANSRVLQEVEPDIHRLANMIETTLMDIIAPYTQNKPNIKSPGERS